MKPYGFIITNSGERLIAKLLAGTQLVLSKVMVGSGSAGEGTDLKVLEDLITPVAEATTSKPVCSNGIIKMLVEYRSDMNGGLRQGFWLNEFGIFAIDPDEGEILLYYGTLGEYPQYVAPSANGVDVRRFPVCITVGTGVQVSTEYSCDSFVTSEDMASYLNETFLVQVNSNAEELIRQHNANPNAHESLLQQLNAMESRMAALELILATDITSNPFSVKFDTLDRVNAQGVWARAEQKICY